MNFAYTTLYVDDVPAELAFYEAAFGFKTRFLHEAKDYGELESGTTTLAFAKRSLIAEGVAPPSQPNPSAPSFNVAFTAENVEQAAERAVNAGAKLVKPPEVKPWGQTVAYVADTSGFLVEICTPLPS